ncbi:aminoglycoside phosphotransferase family protein [Kitasatospora acidiphila]|uniref:Aminoglycoside phosphotransferase family protein n=1 Tax=Kitasatospora acidiphila TaxID=2567942 RepID=A0A540VYT4_9ACTN|nr:phosphotransferase [Kitasatospora acidiphila]TQF01932.1 aminoglycoside phosphotransferase family protein [Kitasatospora acidiphila]
MQSHETNWIEYFSSGGYRDVVPLAAGMEGAVYRLGQGLVAKVWGRREAAELKRLQKFYSDISRAGLSFATPQILEVREVDGNAVTIERELMGRPLKQFVGAGVPPEADAAVIEVLRGLAMVPATAAMRQLAVLDEPTPLWEGAENWAAALNGLLQRRVASFGDQLRLVVDGFDVVFSQVAELVSRQAERPQSVVHGDVCLENILVGDDLRLTALLDFGFLSGAGDPAWDASIAAGIVDMYGPHAREVDDRLTHRVAREFGYPVELLLGYRAAYGIAASNAYDPNGADGHFSWCAAVLGREDVREALEAVAV